MSKLNQIISFINIVEERGFAAAARKQNISAAAISRHITQLETSLNAQLLTRTTRSIALTEIGAQYYEHCKKIITDLEEAELIIAKSQLEATGLLTVTCNRYFAMHYILPQLPFFIKENPKLQVKLDLAERFPDLHQENIDLLFGVSLEGPQDLVRKQVATTRYVLCASPEYLERYGTPKTPQDLINHRYISHSSRIPNNTLTFKNNYTIYLEPTILLNDSLAICECGILGMGIVKLHEYMVAEALKAKKLIEILPTFQEPSLPVYLYYESRKYLLPKIRRFIDFYTMR